MFFAGDPTHRPQSAIVAWLAWATGIFFFSYAIIQGLKITLTYAKMQDCHAQISHIKGWRQLTVRVAK